MRVLKAVGEARQRCIIISGTGRRTTTTGSGAEALRIARDASVRRFELDPTSWVEVVEGFVLDADAEMESLRTSTPWGQAEVLRYDRYVPERRLTASLRSDAAPLLRQTGLHLESRYRVRVSGVAAILYRDGADFQGLHSDREMRWLDER